MLRSAHATPFFEAAAAPRFLDPADAAMLEAAVAEAHARGFAEGRMAGRAEAQEAAASLERALSAAQRRVVELRNASIAEAIELGCSIADIALGEARFLDVQSLADRIRTALTSLDDADLVVTVAPDDLEAVAEHLDLPSGVQLRADRGVSPGEARLEGMWSSAEITKEAALAVAREVLT